jgi:hypothetical protein
VTKIRVDLTGLSMSGEQRALLAPYFASTVANKDGWIKMHCPIHGDANPSAGVNVITGWWVCQACGERGTIAHLIAREHEWRPPDYGRIVGEDPEWAPTGMVMNLPPEESLPQAKDLEEYSHRLLTKSSDALEYLTVERGIEPKTIERFKIGYRPRENGGDFILPMYHDGAIVNVRYYNPARIPKILNHTGYGSIGLFPDNIIPEHAKLVIVEGEWDCLLTMQHLEKYGYTVRTFTNGTGAIRKLYSDNPAVKRILAREPAEVITIFDCDTPGREAAAHLGRLFDTKDVLLPYPVTEDGGKDLTDYWQERRGRPDEAERQLLDLVTDDTSGPQPSGGASPRRPGKRARGAVSAPVREARRPGRVVPASPTLPLESLISVHCPSLRSALTDPKYDGQIVVLENIEVLNLSDDVEALPKRGCVQGCKRRSGSKQPICDSCPTYADTPDRTWELSVIDNAKIVDDLLGRDDIDQRLPKIHKQLNPPVCEFGESTVREYTSYHPIVIQERGTSQRSLAYCIFERVFPVRPLGVYRVTARLSVSGRGQKKRLIVVSVEEPTKQLAAMPRNCIRPPEDCTAEELRDWIYGVADAFALKHTGIFGQTLLHAVACLLFTSVQHIKIGERGKIESGCLDTVTVGLTRTGKTTVWREIAKVYGIDGPDLAGCLVSGEGITKVGLTAISEQVGSTWFMLPGLIPRNNGGQVIIDELQELVRDNKYAMSELNTVRASGIVNLSKAAYGQVEAMVRLATIMNPPERMVDRFIEGIASAYVTPESRARIHLVVAAERISLDRQQWLEEHARDDDLPYIPFEQRLWQVQSARNSPAITIPVAGRFGRFLDKCRNEYGKLYAPEHDHIGVMHPETVRHTLMVLSASIANFRMNYDDSGILRVDLIDLQAAKLILDDVNEASGYAIIMRERQERHSQLDSAIRQAVRRLRLMIASKGGSDRERRTARAFVSRWDGFKIDERYLHSNPQWSAIADEIAESMRQNLLIPDKGGASTNNYILRPEFEKALRKLDADLRQREEA